LTFNMNLNVSEVDEIINDRLKLTRALEKYQVSFEKWKETEQKILNIFKRLGIRPRWTLTGEIPGEAVYWVWYDLKDNVHIMKLEDLAPEAEKLDPNTMYIPFLDMDAVQDSDEDEDERQEREQREAAQRLRYEKHNRSINWVRPKEDDEETGDEN
jgi:hypothetical protein